MSAGSKAAAAPLSENQGEIISLHYSPGGKVSSPFALKMALVRSARRACRGLVTAAKFRGAQSSHEIVERALPGKTGGNFELLRECAHVSRPRRPRPRLRNLLSVASPLSLPLFPSPSHLSGPIQGFRFIGCRAALLIQGLRLGGLHVDLSFGMVCENSLWNKRTLCITTLASRPAPPPSFRTGSLSLSSRRK